MFRAISIAALSLLLAACGTTPEAELRYAAAGGTFMKLDTMYILQNRLEYGIGEGYGQDHLMAS